MKHSWLGDKVSVSGAAYILCVILLLTIPIRWIFAAFLSAWIHELCHLMIIKLCGKNILSMKISTTGAEIETDTVYGWQEILCLAAGPIGSLSLLLLFRWLPLTALFGFVQGIFNLLPILPLDGGRILNCILRFFFDSITTSWIMKIIQWFSFLCLVAVSIYFSFVLKFGKWPFLLLALLAINLISRKIPCKLSQLRVQ